MRGDTIQGVIDKALAVALTGGGASGLTVQWLTGFSNLVLIGLNIALAAGGLYLLWLRIRRLRREKLPPPE